MAAPKPNLRAKLESVPESARTPLMRRYARAYALLDEAQAALEALPTRARASLAAVAEEASAVRACAQIARALELTDLRLSPTVELMQAIPLVDAIAHLTPAPEVPEDRPSVDKANRTALLRVGAAEAVVVLVGAWRLVCTRPLAPAMRACDELRLHLEAGLLDAERWARAGAWAADTPDALLPLSAFARALGRVGAYACRSLYRQPAQLREDVPGANMHGALDTARLRANLARHARCALRLSPGYAHAHGALGWAAHTGGAAGAEELGGYADALHCWRACMACADAAGDDVLRCVARIEVATFMAVGGDGWVGLPSSGAGVPPAVVVRRELRSAAYADPDPKLEVQAPPSAREAILARERARAQDPARRCALDPGERLLVEHWVALPLWAEARALSEKLLAPCGLDEYAYGESSGSAFCAAFEQMTREANGGRGLARGNFANAQVFRLPSTVRTPGDGRADRALAEERLLRCHACGKLSPGEKLRQCAQCHQVRYCDRECQRAHWKKHKRECAALAQASAAQKK